jgi:hypothetical protein
MKTMSFLNFTEARQAPRCPLTARQLLTNGSCDRGLPDVGPTLSRQIKSSITPSLCYSALLSACVP